MLTGMKDRLLSLYRSTLPKPMRSQIYRYIDNLASPARYKSLMAKGLLSLEDKNLRQMKMRLRALRGRYAGQRCFVMGNGPSLNKMDLALFKDELVWGTNKCYLLFDRIDWRPSFYVAVDVRVVPDIAETIMSMTQEYPRTGFFFPLHFRVERTLTSRDNIYWYKEAWRGMDARPERLFTRDASAWVSQVASVTVAALQLAVYLGFNPIYLIGCDTSYNVSQTVRRDCSNPDGLLSTANDDMNHFDPHYFGTGSKWHEPHVERMIFHYQQAKTVCDTLGVRVLNATVGGQLEVFPRVDYRTLF